MSHPGLRSPPRLNLAKLKVRPVKGKESVPCGAEMAAMLACWASHGDTADAKQCAAFADNLKKCMSTTVKQPPKVNTINYHLARLGKLL
ncbi:hypothetical protein PYCC9005_002205 [Savitreella phatthalungensis]